MSAGDEEGEAGPVVRELELEGIPVSIGHGGRGEGGQGAQGGRGEGVSGWAARRVRWGDPSQRGFLLKGGGIVITSPPFLKGRGYVYSYVIMMEAY